MFRTVTLRGVNGAVVAGYRTAVALPSWTIARDAKGAWTLVGTGVTPDAFYLRLSSLIFTAPRRRGMWCWPIRTVTLHGTKVVATLGPPEQ